MASVAETRRGFEHGPLARGALLLGALLLVMLIAAGAQATAISVELPGLTGPLPYAEEVPVGISLQHPEPTGYATEVFGLRSSDFDLGSAFSSVSGAQLHLVGHTECPDAGCPTPPQLTAFFQTAGPPGTVGRTSPPGTNPPGLRVASSGPLSGEFELTLDLPAVQGLKDGTGSIDLILGTAPPSFVGVRAPFPWDGGLIFAGSPPPPELVITSARLTVTGDALGDSSLPVQTVPEPSELALAGVALGAFSVGRRRGRQPKAS